MDHYKQYKSKRNIIKKIENTILYGGGILTFIYLVHKDLNNLTTTLSIIKTILIDFILAWFWPIYWLIKAIMLLIGF